MNNPPMDSRRPIALSRRSSDSLDWIPAVLAIAASVCMTFAVLA